MYKITKTPLFTAIALFCMAVSTKSVYADTSDDLLLVASDNGIPQTVSIDDQQQYQRTYTLTHNAGAAIRGIKVVSANNSSNELSNSDITNGFQYENQCKDVTLNDNGDSCNIIVSFSAANLSEDEISEFSFRIKYNTYFVTSAQ